MLKELRNQMYQSKIDIVVQSRFQNILNDFILNFWPTVKKFENLKLHILHKNLKVKENEKTVSVPHDDFGIRVINPEILTPILKSGEYNIFGIFNDDLWFTEGWLESVLSLLERNDCVAASPGYAETQIKKDFEKAVEETSNDDGFQKLFYGPVGLFKVRMFKRIGGFDDRYDWSCDDLDFAWRAHLNGLETLTARKVTVGHQLGLTLTQTRGWNETSEINKNRFYNKHGYVAYREIRRMYKEHHQYFRQFKQVHEKII